MSIAALIPARKGSKGIKNKNIVDLFGKPLIAWTIEKAIKSKCFDSVIVSTDCEKIAEISKIYGAKVPYLRPAEFAQDKSTRNDVISHFFEENKNFNQLFYLQPTSPFRSTKSIQKFKFFANQISELPAISVFPVSSNPSTVLLNKNDEWLFFDKNLTLNRQDNDSQVHKMDGAFFYITRNYWLKMKDKGPDFMRTKDTRYFINIGDGLFGSLDIDNKVDLEFARKLEMN